MNRAGTAWFAVVIALGLAFAIWAWLGRSDGDTGLDAHSDLATRAPSYPLGDPGVSPPIEENALAPDVTAGGVEIEQDPAHPTQLTTDDALLGVAPDVAAGSSATDDAREVDPPFVPLENLLRVPESEEFPHLESDDETDAQLTDSNPRPTRNGSRVRIDGKRQHDSLEEDPSQKREQVDAGASVDVNESTRIRGGVRIERDPDSAVTETEEIETAPMIGVEKRF